MIYYAIQIDDIGFPTTEMGYFAKEALDFSAWRGFKNNITLFKTPIAFAKNKEASDLIIPIGSLEFVEASLKNIYGINSISQINIPPQLMGHEYTKRNVKRIHGTEKEIVEAFKNENKLFVKSETIFKASVNDLYPVKDFVNNRIKLPLDNYIVSSEIDIIAEWRTFVHNGEILGIHQYSGDFTEAFNYDWIKHAVEHFTDSPTSYTLDFAKINTNDKKEFCIIEVHNFISCGLYGFSSNKLLAMIVNGIKYEVKKE